MFRSHTTLGGFWKCVLDHILFYQGVFNHIIIHRRRGISCGIRKFLLARRTTEAVQKLYNRSRYLNFNLGICYYLFQYFVYLVRCRLQPEVAAMLLSRTPALLGEEKKATSWILHGLCWLLWWLSTFQTRGIFITLLLQDSVCKTVIG